MWSISMCLFPICHQFHSGLLEHVTCDNLAMCCCAYISNETPTLEFNTPTATSYIWDLDPTSPRSVPKMMPITTYSRTIVPLSHPTLGTILQGTHCLFFSMCLGDEWCEEKKHLEPFKSTCKGWWFQPT